MWTLDNSGVTNLVTIPADGIVTVTMPHGVDLCAYINNMDVPIHHMHVKAGDKVHFDIRNKKEAATEVSVGYADTLSKLMIAGKPAKIKEKKMTEAVNLFANPNAGMGSAIGGGLGAGLLGGVLGGALLGGNKGGLFGGNNGGDTQSGINAINLNTDSKIAASTALNEARFNAEAQRELQAAIERTAAATQMAYAVGNSALGVEIAKGQGETNVQVALTTGNLGTQNALNASATQVLVQKNAGDLSTQIALGQAQLGVQVATNGTATALAFKDAAIDNLRTSALLQTTIVNDGEKTRSLITSQYEATLNRQLATAQNEIIEMRGDRRLQEATGNITISNVNTATAVAQQQQQQQQQQQIATLLANVNALYAQNQHIQQGVLNIGSGTVSGNSQTAANTRVA
jgi:hypothetical protein